MVHMVLNHNLLSLLCQQNHADVSTNGLPMIKGARARTLTAPHNRAMPMRSLGVWSRTHLVKPNTMDKDGLIATQSNAMVPTLLMWAATTCGD